MPPHYIHISNKVNSDFYFLVDKTIKIMSNVTTITMSDVIHIGLKTHIQLQAINQVSLSVINTIVSRPTNPIHDVLFCVPIL